MMIKVIIGGGIVPDVETSEPAAVQIVNADDQALSTFNTVAQIVRFEPDPEEPELKAPPQPMP